MFSLASIHGGLWVNLAFTYLWLLVVRFFLESRDSDPIFKESSVSIDVPLIVNATVDGFSLTRLFFPSATTIGWTEEKCIEMSGSQRLIHRNSPLPPHSRVCWRTSPEPRCRSRSFFYSSVYLTKRFSVTLSPSVCFLCVVLERHQ